MKISKDKLKKIISEGENQEVEFKEEITNNNKISKEMVAFSNTNDGLLIIGVSDEGEIEGLKDIKKTEERIENICNNNCFPSISPNFKKMDIEGKDLFLVFIKRSKQVVMTNTKSVYIRKGTQSVKPDTTELTNLFLSLNLIDTKIIKKNTLDEEGLYPDRKEIEYLLEKARSEDTATREVAITDIKILCHETNVLLPDIIKFQLETVDDESYIESQLEILESIYYTLKNLKKEDKLSAIQFIREKSDYFLKIIKDENADGATRLKAIDISAMIGDLRLIEILVRILAKGEENQFLKSKHKIVDTYPQELMFHAFFRLSDENPKGTKDTLYELMKHDNLEIKKKAKDIHLSIISNRERKVYQKETEGIFDDKRNWG